VVALITGMYALMAIPTMTSTLLLAPRVMNAARDYFQRMAVAEEDVPADGYAPPQLEPGLEQIE
jgi:AGCS family alanine or glycine:cation symporter